MKLLKKNKIKIVAFGTSTVLQNNSIFDSLQKKFNEEKFNNIEIENKPVDYTVSRVKFVNLEYKQEIKIRGFYYV